MIPRTKLEREVFALSQKLVPRTSRIEKTLKRYTKEKCANYYHVIAEKHGDFQVFRYFRIENHKRKPTQYWEAQQLWYGKGKEIVIARRRTQYAIDSFAPSSDLEIRRFGYRYYGTRPEDIGIWTMDVVSVRPEWERKDLRQVGRISHLKDISTAKRLSPYMETLYNQHHDLFCRLAISLGWQDLRDRQGEIKVALRHGYKFEKPTLWSDTITLAKNLGIETRNPYYCAPKDTKALHDQLLKKQQRLRKMQEKKRKEEEAKLFEKKYRNHVKPFLDLLLKGKNVEIMPLLSVNDVKEEGDIMHHCVFACGYYKKTNVLLLTAQVNGKHVETIEFDLKRFVVLQSRGLQNKQTEYHEEILALMQANAKNIEKLTRKAA